VTKASTWMAAASPSTLLHTDTDVGQKASVFLSHTHTLDDEDGEQDQPEEGDAKAAVPARRQAVQEQQARVRHLRREQRPVDVRVHGH
jgi:hypothetical protein